VNVALAEVISITNSVLANEEIMRGTTGRF
jgi:hypothetical protein